MSLDSDLEAVDIPPRVVAAGVGELVEAYTARGWTCPDCGGPLVGARVMDFEKQEAVIGVVCEPCSQPYRVVWEDAS